MAIANSDGSIIITTKLDVTPVSKALNALKSKFASLKEQRSAIQALTTAIKDQQFVIKDLEKEYAMLVAQGKGNSTNAEELKARIAELKAELQQLTGAASAMGVKTAAASTKAAQGLKQFGKRIAGIIKSALVFSVLYKVMQAVVKLFQNILMSDEEFRQDWEELKAAFYTAAYPIINLIVPAIKWIVQQVRDWAVSIGKVAAALQGMSYSELVDQAKASKEAADNYADMEKSSKKTADNVKKEFASFDDIQILSSGNEEEQGAGSAGFEGLGQYDTSGEKSMLDDLMTSIGGALAAVGIILLFKGQISWGMGFLIVGAAFWGISEINSRTFSVNPITNAISKITKSISISLAAVGLILITKGQWTWGLGFIIAGAAFWMVSEISTVEFSEDPILNTLAKITESIGASLAAVGLMLIIKGIWTWGLAFVAAGASFWAITEIATTEFSTDLIQNSLIKIMGIIGASLAAVGVLLCVLGGPAALPWGIGFIIAGAVAFVSAVAINSDAIVEAIRGPIGVITAIVGASLLVLGIMLVCTGNLILGIPLIVAGAADLVTPIALNADAIVNWISGVWDAVKGFWNKNIAPIFTGQFWLDLGKSCMNGLISGFESGVNGIIWLFESMIQFIVDGLNLFLRGVDKVISAVGDVFGGDWGVATIPDVKLPRVNIPRLAQGTVVPPNKEFMAVLGDNTKEHEIVSPVSTMKQAFMEAMLEMGGNFGGGNTEVVLEIDGREFGRAVVEQGNRENRRIGTRLVIV